MACQKFLFGPSKLASQVEGTEQISNVLILVHVLGVTSETNDLNSKLVYLKLTIQLRFII